MGQQLGVLLLVQGDRHRLQQSLGLPAAALGLQPLVEQPLMGGVLVDEHQLIVPPLQNEVGAKGLPHHAGGEDGVRLGLLGDFWRAFQQVLGDFGLFWVKNGFFRDFFGRFWVKNRRFRAQNTLKFSLFRRRDSGRGFWPGLLLQNLRPRIRQLCLPVLRRAAVPQHPRPHLRFFPAQSHFRPLPLRKPGLLLALQHRRIRRGLGPPPLHDFGLVPRRQRRPHPMVHRVKNRPLIHKPDLHFCRVYVHVHSPESQLQMQHTGREFSHHKGALVGLFQGRHGRAAADVPPVDKEVLHAAVGAAPRRRADKALHLYMLQLVLHRDEGRGKLPAVHGVNRRGELVVARGVELLLPVPDEPEGDLRMGQGHLVQNPGDGITLCSILFQEFHPGRGVIKQVPDQDGGAVGAARLLQGGLLFPAAGVAHPGLGLPGLGEQLYVGHGGDGGQRLPAEAQGHNGVQVILLRDLAGGVAQKGGGHILLGDTAAVVRHPHKGGAAPADLHGDHTGSGVYGIFHQLLDYGGGALHHLPGGDQFRHLLV